MNYYFHVPFCRSKCGYCAFYSHPAAKPEEIDDYLDCLETQVAAYKITEPCETIYFGGGTPTLLSCRQLERLFQLAGKLQPTPETEITMEANPETIDAAKVELLRNQITRLSLGVQSFRPEHRETLGRNCRQHALEQALQLIQNAQFPHWNCDLIYAIPGETISDWEQELRQATTLGCDHLSCYNLTPEEGARLSDRLIPDEEDSIQMWRMAGSLLGMAGIERYEISNYARAGAACRHNCNVWRGGRLQGFGPAAAGFNGIYRQSEPESLADWLAGAAPAVDELPHQERLHEIFAVQLRTVTGWSPAAWSQVAPEESWETRLDWFVSHCRSLPADWFNYTDNRIRLTEDGLLFWNTIAEELL